MKRTIILILLLAAMPGCNGSFLNASKYFTGPVTGVGLKASTAIASGGTEQLYAVVVPVKTANNNVTWTCTPSDGSVVTVNAATGLVTAVAAPLHGTTASAVVTVTTEEGGFTASCNVTVTEKPIAVTGVTLNKKILTMLVNASQQLSAVIAPATATDQSLTWTSANTLIAAVDASGLVTTGSTTGTTTITATSADGKYSDTCTITVTATPVLATAIGLNKTATKIAVGKSETVYAHMTPAAVTSQNVTWSTGTASVATVDVLGNVTAVSAGTATITATTTDGTSLSASMTVTVVATEVAVTGLTLSNQAILVTAGRQTQLAATVTPANATDQSVNWTSNNACAVVDSSGLVTGMAAGTAVITASAANGSFSQICYVIVTTTPTYTVTYDFNGGKGNLPVDSNSYAAGSAATVLTSAAVFRAGYTCTGWNTMKNGTGTAYSTGTSLVVGGDLVLYAAWVARYRWVSVGSSGFGDASDSTNKSANTALDPSGTPYMVYRDADNERKVTVRKYVGVSAACSTGWETVGSAGFSSGRVDYTSIAFDPSGTPYVAFQHSTDSGCKAAVMKYIGISAACSTGWEIVGREGSSESDVEYTRIAIDPSGTPYVVYKDLRSASSLKATVMKYVGVSETFPTGWETVGSAGFSAGNVDYTSIAIDPNGMLYVGYEDAGSGKATVMKYNSTSQAWQTVGSTGFADGPYTRIAIDPSGTPYMVYEDELNSNKATVMKYNSISLAWETVGSAGFSADAATYPSIAFDSAGTPYVAYNDANAGATVMKYNSTSLAWETVGSAKFSADGAYYTDIVIDPYDVLYAGYLDKTTGMATVMQFQ